MSKNNKAKYSFFAVLAVCAAICVTVILVSCTSTADDGGETTGNTGTVGETLTDTETGDETQTEGTTTSEDTTEAGTTTADETTTEAQTTEAQTTEAQTTEAETTKAPEPVKHGVTFSHAPGFYDKDFTLTLTSDGGTIYYTTDGSTPTKSSKKYSVGIKIYDKTKDANEWSARTDVTTAFLNTSSDYGKYKVPNYNVDKCTMIRAVVYYKDGSTSEIETGTYFVGFKNKTGYDKMNIITIMTEPDNLFGYNNGIYVRGKTFDDYWYNRIHGVTKWFDPYWWWWDCNYNQKGQGKLNERPATIQIFSPTRELLLTKDVGIRIQGGGSRGKIPRSFNIYARKEYDDTSKLGFTPFGTSYNPQRVTLFAGGDANENKFNDWIMAKLCSGLNFATMDFAPYTLFLDGEYWGNYWLTEKYDEEYIHYHYGVKKSNVIIIKNGVLEEGEANDVSTYYDMVDYISNHDMRDAGNYKSTCELIDIESFIDYYAAEVFIDRYNDWPTGNFALWRARDEETGNKYGDTKWRWMLFDVNSGAMDKSRVGNTDSVQQARKDSVFNSLWKNDTFKEKFKKRLKELAQNEFNYDLEFIPALNEFKSIMNVPMESEFRRFYGKTDMSSYSTAVDRIRSFFHHRIEYIDLLDYSDK